jgi:membrane-associated protein
MPCYTKTMLFGVSLTDAIHTIGVIGILAIVFAESGMLVGFLLPGDTLLFTAGFLTQQGTLAINIHLLVLLIALAAIVGDNIGYFIGHKVGRRLFSKPDSVLFHQKNLQKAEKFYEKYGVFTIMIARFIPVVRSFGPVVAGIGDMKYAQFFLYDVIGGLLWASSITYLGFYGGEFLESKGIDVEMLVMPIILLAIFISIASPTYHILREKESREALLRKLRIKK